MTATPVLPVESSRPYPSRRRRRGETLVGVLTTTDPKKLGTDVSVDGVRFLGGRRPSLRPNPGAELGLDGVRFHSRGADASFRVECFQK